MSFVDHRVDDLGREERVAGRFDVQSIGELPPLRRRQLQHRRQQPLDLEFVERRQLQAPHTRQLAQFRHDLRRAAALSPHRQQKQYAGGRMPREREKQALALRIGERDIVQQERDWKLLRDCSEHLCGRLVQRALVATALGECRPALANTR